MMKSEDYVKYLTTEMMRYIDEPEEERRKRRQQRKAEREPWLMRWFGLLPMSFSLWNDGIQSKRKRIAEWSGDALHKGKHRRKR